jgi:hypothetical protein
MTRALVCAALLLAAAACSPATVSRSPAPATSAVASQPATSSPSASASPVTATRLTGVAKKLDAGTYVFDNARPHVTMQVPRSWYLSEAMPRHFGLHPDDVLDAESVRVWYDMRVASGAQGCPEEPALGTGHRALDLVQAFTSDHRLVATTPKRVSLGGLQGNEISLGLAPDWKQSCPFTNGTPTVPLFLDDNVADEPAFWGVSGPERLRLMVLDDGHGSNVLIMLDSTSGKTLDDLQATVRPVLDSFRFDPSS